MQVTWIETAKPDDAPGHFAMTGLRPQGHETSEVENFWAGLFVIQGSPATCGRTR